MSLSFSSQEVEHNIQTDKTHYRLIILIISSDNETYDLFKQCWRGYMNSFPNVKSYFLVSNPDLKTDIHVDSDTIYQRSQESNVPGIFFKSTAGMSVCDSFFQYDYLLRTNLSSFYHIPRLLKYLDTKPANNYVGSQFYNLPNDPSKTTQQAIVNKYLGLTLNDKFIFLHGAGFILSRDVVTKYIHEIKTNEERVKEVMILPDDVAMSLILFNFLTLPPNFHQENYYHPIEFENIYNLKHQCKTLEDPTQHTDESIFHFRNKMDDSCIDNTITRRKIDVLNFIRQIRHFYNKPDFMKDAFGEDGEYVDLCFRPKLIDCFIFYNEIDMLLYRLEVLDKTVDFFVLVESTRTFTGKDKPLLYEQNKHLFEKYNHKIVHIVVDDMPIPDISKDEQWKNENYQRNCIDRGIKCLGLTDKDYILISDLDEIPDPTVINKMRDKEYNDVLDYVSLKQDFYYYNLNHKINELWVHPKMIRYDTYIKTGRSPQNIRMGKSQYLIEKGGWHLSYFGDPNFIKNKLENFPHQEFNKPEIVDTFALQNKMNAGIDILDRPGISFERIPISENKYLPPFYDTMLAKFILF